MDRPIRVRGWHTEQKRMFSTEEMTEDQLTLLPTGQFINVDGTSTKLSEIYPRDRFIPLQYTGLKDSEGKDIYEGDILEWAGADLYRKWIVEATSGGWNPFIDNMTTDKPYRYIVTGNIYENPEKLRQDEE